MRDALADARRNERLYYAVSFFAHFGLWSGIWIKYLTATREFELRYILLMDLPFWVLVAVLETPFGALADRMGRKRVLALGCAFMSLTILGFGLATTYWMLFFDYVLWAFALALMSGVDQALVYDSLQEAGTQGRFQRIAGRGMAIQVGAGLVSVMLGGVFAAATSLAFTVQVSAAFPLVAAVLAMVMVEPPLVATGKKYLRDLGDGFAFAWRHVQVRYSVFAGSVLLAAGFAPVVLVQPFLIEYDVATAVFGAYQVPLSVASVAAALVAYRVASRTGVLGMLIGAAAGVVVAFAGVGLVGHIGAFAFFAVPSMIRGLIRPTLDGYINERTPSERRATILSISSLCLSVQLAVFEPILGFFADLQSVAAASLFAAGWFGVVLPPLLWLWRRAQRREGPVREALEAAGTA